MSKKHYAGWLGTWFLAFEKEAGYMPEQKDKLRKQAIDLLGAKHYGNQWQAIKERRDATVDTVEAYAWMGEVVDGIIALLPDTATLLTAFNNGYARRTKQVEEAKKENAERVDAMMVEAIRTAKKQERKDVGLELQLALSKVVNKPNFNQYRLSEFITISAHKLISGQALKEIKGEKL